MESLEPVRAARAAPPLGVENTTAVPAVLVGLAPEVRRITRAVQHTLLQRAQCA